MSGDKVVMVVGPGPVTLGQGPAFQFTAARGCRHLRRMGIRVIVLEDNPSTLMDVGGGEEDLFMEPPAPEVVEKVVKRTGAQSIWFSLGGKRGWNLALRLAGEGWYEKLGLASKGIEDRALWLCGDRSLLRETLENRGISNPAFRAVADVREGQEAAVSLGFPLMVRPHFSCGGWGAGLAYNLEEYPLLLEEAMRESITGEVLIEEALIGWRKCVVLALRDGEGRSHVAGIIEQAEPLPRHDQDAVLVYPPLSIGEEEAYGLGEMAKEVAEALDIVGMAEIKLAVDPGWKDIYVIDVNPYPWRTFPLLETALGGDLLGMHINLVMGGELTRERIEPKGGPGFGIMLAVPRLVGYGEENKGEGYTALGCRALGRRVYVGKDLGEAVEEAVRGLIGTREGNPEREVMKGVRALEARLGKAAGRRARTERKGENAREVERALPLCISRTSRGDLGDGVVFLAGDDGSPGGGYEAEVNCLHALGAWREAGGKALLFTPDPFLAMYGSGEADAVYLGPLEAGALGGVASSTGMRRFAVGYGGRAALDCGKDLARAGFEVMDSEMLKPATGIVQALDRLSDSEMPVVAFRLSGDMEEGSEVLEEGIYPLVAAVDSGGIGPVQRLIYTEEDGRAFLEEFPHEVVLWREVREGQQEVQVEAIAAASKNHVVLAWEQVDEAGICACDGLAVYPPSYLTSGQSCKVSALAKEAMDVLGWRGNLSMRMVFDDGEVYMWEVTPGPSANLPFIRRASGKPLAAWGFMALSGRDPEGMTDAPPLNVVRAPLIPFGAIASSDILPSPQRRSTGTVLGVASSPGVALAKALWSEGLRPQPGGIAFLSVANRETRRALLLARELQAAGYILMATRGTAQALAAAGLKIETVNKLREGRPNILDHVRNGEVGLVINIPRGKSPHSDGFYIRVASARHGIPCITNMEVALALAQGLRNADPAGWEVLPLKEYGRSRQEVRDG
jgi:carbamoylphosphate synthase large subunit